MAPIINLSLSLQTISFYMYLIRSDGSSICHIDLDHDPLLTFANLRVIQKIGVLEGCVGQSIAKGIRRGAGEIPVGSLCHGVACYGGDLQQETRIL